jgi:DNA-binding transcriptional LysR family regulator
MELILDDLIVDLVGEGFDIGFRVSDSEESNLISKKIARNRLLVVAAPAFIDKYGKPNTIPKLENQPAFVYSAHGSLLS